MDWVLLILLFLHVAGAIVGLGPSFALGIIAAAGGAEPLHTNFALRLQERLSTRLVLPAGIVQGITGVLLIWKLGLNVFSTLWLAVAIVLYLIVLATSWFVAIPTARQLIAATSNPPPPPPEGAPRPSGPPPHIAALVRRGQMSGITISVLMVVIIFLMVTKPF